MTTIEAQVERMIEASTRTDTTIHTAYSWELAQELACQADDSARADSELEYWGETDEGGKWRIHLGLPSVRDLVLCRSDLGDGGWSLHAPGAPDHAAGADILLSGDAEWDEREGWSRPDARDYDRALAKLVA